MPTRRPPLAPAIRFRVEPGDVPAEKVARRLHLSLEAFALVLPRLLARGFPAADPDTAMFDLEAVDRWRHGRHHRLFPELTAAPDAGEPAPSRSMGERFREAQERRRHG